MSVLFWAHARSFASDACWKQLVPPFFNDSATHEEIDIHTAACAVNDYCKRDTPFEVYYQNTDMDSLVNVLDACELTSDDADTASGAYTEIKEKRESECVQRMIAARSYAEIKVCAMLYPDLIDMIPAPTATPRTPKPTANTMTTRAISEPKRIKLRGGLLNAFYVTALVDIVLLLLIIGTLCGCCGAKIPENIK